MNKRARIVIAVIAFAVAAFVVVTPSVFAQTGTYASSSAGTATTSEENVDPRAYAEWIYSVFNYVYANYIDEVDPKVLYEGAMRGLLDAFGDPQQLQCLSS